MSNYTHKERRNPLMGSLVELCEAAKAYAENPGCGDALNKLCDAAARWGRPVSEVRLRVIGEVQQQVAVLRQRVLDLEAQLEKARQANE